jgi:hypothetical protein
MGAAALRDGLIARDRQLHFSHERDTTMSRIIDADSHFMEPLDLWERYIEPKYRSLRGIAAPCAVFTLPDA